MYVDTECLTRGGGSNSQLEICKSLQRFLSIEFYVISSLSFFSFFRREVEHLDRLSILKHKFSELSFIAEHLNQK